MVVEGLHADRDAIDACLFPCGELLLFGARRIGFEGDFAIWREGEVLLCVFEDGFHRVRGEEGGGSAAEENRVDGARVILHGWGVAEVSESPEDSPHIVLFGNIGMFVRVEVAIGAFALAIGKVDVERKRRVCS